jgi:hypothetical protein
MYNFTLKQYRNILKIALSKGYSFLGFEEIKNSSVNKYCLLRHDIDADIHAALQMAKIEHELGIKSTYFFMLRSPVYNLFGRENFQMAIKIINLGHYVGLHFDEGFVINKSELPEKLINELKIFSIAFNTEVKVFSVHQPSVEMINNPIKLNNLINTYDYEYFKDIYYISDSNMIWKEFYPDELFEREIYTKIQMLIHPMWWVGNGSQNTEELWNKAIFENHIRSLKQIIKTERAFGPERYLSEFKKI